MLDASVVGIVTGNVSGGNVGRAVFMFVGAEVGVSLKVIVSVGIDVMGKDVASEFPAQL